MTLKCMSQQSVELPRTSTSIRSGIFELKYFFNLRFKDNGNLASEAVKSKIKQLIDKEDGKKPLSDQKLVELLKEGGVTIARRTVAKYREAMNILPSSKRKRLF